MKSPYSFPHRSRKAILAYLAEHQGYHPMNSWNGGFVLAWNIKVYSFDSTGHVDGVKVNSRFDEQWQARVDNDSDLFWHACQDATRQFTEGEWSNYPGIEQGEWEFGINGRSGGYLVLTEAPSWLPAPRRWSLFSMTWDSRADFEEWLAELATPILRQFYRAIRVLDHDLSRDACSREVAYQYGFARECWEEQLLAEEDSAVAELEQSRPDMYTTAKRA